MDHLCDELTGFGHEWAVLADPAVRVALAALAGTPLGGRVRVKSRATFLASISLAHFLVPP